MKVNSALPQVDDPLGLWEPFDDTALSQSSGDMVSFSVSDAPSERAVQPVQLPADEDAALAQLTMLRSTMRRGRVQLNQAEHQIVNLRRGFQPAKVRGVSFSVPELAPSEASLYTTLDTLDFAVPEELGPVRQKQAGDLQNWRKFVAQVQSKISNPIQVSTQMGANLIGYTAMDWSGDSTTIWRPNVSARVMTLHRQTVDLVLAKISARLRLVVVVSTEASKLALKLTGPLGTQLLVIPAVWHFVREVLETLRLQPEFQN